MIRFLLRRVGLGLASAAVLATSAAIIVVALAIALFAVLRPHFGIAGGAAIVAGGAALMMAFAGLGLMAAARQPPSSPLSSKDPGERLIAFVEKRPIAAIAAAIAAGILAIRNPKYLGAALRSFSEGRGETRRNRKR